MLCRVCGKPLEIKARGRRPEAHVACGRALLDLRAALRALPLNAASFEAVAELVSEELQRAMETAEAGTPCFALRRAHRSAMFRCANGFYLPPRG